MQFFQAYAHLFTQLQSVLKDLKIHAKFHPTRNLQAASEYDNQFLISCEDRPRGISLEHQLLS